MISDYNLGPPFMVRCNNCNCEFRTDPTDEENLVLMGDALVEECPNCKEINIDTDNII